ncbi:hypothetical protein LVY74_03360 [Acinetobacter sp. ME22]|uniref:hypothetical protein n=1 Tax=Acinetobacter sp. ME22 TaxID=2904802 RepID=UPI001EDC6A03|nr:hypothetical protein [Acinetobacter sp. ME22]MCG2572598.1 hypothetical protein [Acinetobacter sp. ME22]
MKKLVGIIILGWVSCSSFAAMTDDLKVNNQQELEQKLDQSTQKHDQEMQDFLKSIDPKATQFTQKQSQRFCQITQGLINDMYAVLDRNRDLLAAEDRSLTKAEFIQQAVYAAPDYQSLQKMGVNCKLN